MDKRKVLAKPKVPEIQKAVIDKPYKGGKKYTENEIHDLTVQSGYIVVHPQLWDHIPTSAHVRFVKKDDGSGLSRSERFKPGGFVRNHFTTGEKKMMMLASSPYGDAARPEGYISFPVAYDDIEELWKKYDKNSFVEIHLIHNSLALKKQQIEILEAQNREMSNRIAVLEEILKNAIRK